MRKSLVLVFVLSSNTMLCFAQISPVNDGNWQDSSIWPGGQLPGSSSDVVIPSSTTIGLSGDITVKSITVNGVLSATPGAPINLQTEWVTVMGDNALLEVGTATNPFDNACTITLNGNNDGDDVMGMGDKLIGAIDGARIEFHGQPKISWSRLGNTADSGATQITMAEPVDWNIGDEIVVVSSTTRWDEAEQRTITAISSDSLTINVDSALDYPHFGTVSTYTRSTDDKTWTADTRAEVGLLSHNIKIQGDESSTTNGYGGHIICMPDSIISASSIELYRMGQKGDLGRYPWHWHHVHLFGAGQYFKDSSVHQSFNRAITIHGTSYVTVENNFFYDHIGHGVFLEDGSERFNTIRNNVVLLSKRPLAGEEVTPSDNELDQVQNRTPSSFWITNPNNYFEGNVAAGTQGTGYWFALPRSPMGSSAGMSIHEGLKPYQEPLGSFLNNKAHSCMSGFDIFDQLKADHSIRKNAGWEDSALHFIDGCTWYANSLGIYTGIGAVGALDKVTYTSNLIFVDNIFVENKTNMQLASYSQVQDSVIVALALGTLSSSDIYRIYDGAGQVRDCHLVGWNGSTVHYLRDGGAATKHTNHRLSGITTEDGVPVRVRLRDYDIPIANDDPRPQNWSLSRVWNIVLYDEDGSFSGVPSSSIVSNHPMMLVGDEDQPVDWENAYRSPHKFVLSMLTFPGLSVEDYPNLTCTRMKIGTPTASAYDAYGYKDHIQFPFIVNEGFMYNYQFESLPLAQSITVTMDDAEVGDTYLIRFKDFGKLGGLNLINEALNSLPGYTSMDDLNNSDQTAFLSEPNGDLYVIFVATQFRDGFNINWSTDFAVPILDTDGDGVSDRQEIINGANPFDQITCQDECNDGNSDDGNGDDGSSDDGNGNDGNGDDSNSDDDNGDDGHSDDGSNDDGSNDDGSNDDGNVDDDDGNGDDGNSHDGYGDDGYGDDGYGDDDDGNHGRCFSPYATAMVKDKGKVYMRDLAVGNKVLSASGQYETVYTINHFHHTKPTHFLQIYTDLENPLELTAMHLVYVEGGKDPVPALNVKVDDSLQTLHRGPRRVKNIKAVTRNGLYNPITTDGTMVVDGIIASSYTSFTGSAYLEIAGAKIISVHDILDMTIAPYRVFCGLTNNMMCNNHGEEELPLVVQLVSNFYYEFFAKQHALVQCVVIVFYLFIFSLINAILSEYGMFLVGAIAGCFLLTKGITAHKKSGQDVLVCMPFQAK